MSETNSIWYEGGRALKEIIRMDASSSSSSHLLTREQQGLLNFDEIVALWYFILALWYGYFRFRNSTTIQRPNNNSANDNDNYNANTQYGFSPIHCLIVSIAIMGLANFLFSVSLLEAMDHRSSIGSSVMKLSYVSEYTTRNTRFIAV